MGVLFEKIDVFCGLVEDSEASTVAPRLCCQYYLSFQTSLYGCENPPYRSQPIGPSSMVSIIFSPSPSPSPSPYLLHIPIVLQKSHSTSPSRWSKEAACVVPFDKSIPAPFPTTQTAHNGEYTKPTKKTPSEPQITTQIGSSPPPPPPPPPPPTSPSDEPA